MSASHLFPGSERVDTKFALSFGIAVVSVRDQVANVGLPPWSLQPGCKSETDRPHPGLANLGCGQLRSMDGKGRHLIYIALARRQELGQTSTS